MVVHLVRAEKHGSIQHWPVLNFLSVGKTGMSVACLQYQTSVLDDVMAHPPVALKHRAVRSINQSCTANCIHFSSRLEFVLQLIWASEEKGKRLVSAVLSKGTGSFCSQHLWVWVIFGGLSCWGISIEIVAIYSPLEYEWEQEIGHYTVYCQIRAANCFNFSSRLELLLHVIYVPEEERTRLFFSILRGVGTILDDCDTVQGSTVPSIGLPVMYRCK